MAEIKLFLLAQQRLHYKAQTNTPTPPCNHGRRRYITRFCVNVAEASSDRCGLSASCAVTALNLRRHTDLTQEQSRFPNVEQTLLFFSDKSALNCLIFQCLQTAVKMQMISCGELSFHFIKTSCEEAWSSFSVKRFKGQVIPSCQRDTSSYSAFNYCN